MEIKLNDFVSDDEDSSNNIACLSFFINQKQKKRRKSLKASLRFKSNLAHKNIASTPTRVEHKFVLFVKSLK